MKKEKQKKGVVKMGSGLPVFNPYAAGIDIGDTLHCVAIAFFQFFGLYRVLSIKRWYTNILFKYISVILSVWVE